MFPAQCSAVGHEPLHSTATAKAVCSKTAAPCSILIFEGSDHIRVLPRVSSSLLLEGSKGFPVHFKERNFASGCFTIVGAFDLRLDAKFSKSPQCLTIPRTHGCCMKVLGVYPDGHFTVGLQPYGGAAQFAAFPEQPASPCLEASVPAMMFLL